MLEPFTLDYCWFVFVGTLAVVQFVAARSGLHGLLFLRPWPRLTQLVSSVAFVASFVWFFGATGSRNIPDTGAGLEANTQTAAFAAAAAIAIALTFLNSSILNHRWGYRGQVNPAENVSQATGLSRLEHTTFALALTAQFRAWSRWRR